MGARREITAAVVDRYRSAGRADKGRILDELCAVTGWHRKHAVRHRLENEDEAASAAWQRRKQRHFQKLVVAQRIGASGVEALAQPIAMAVINAASRTARACLVSWSRCWIWRASPPALPSWGAFATVNCRIDQRLDQRLGLSPGTSAASRSLMGRPNIGPPMPAGGGPGGVPGGGGGPARPTVASARRSTPSVNVAT